MVMYLGYLAIELQRQQPTSGFTDKLPLQKVINFFIICAPKFLFSSSEVKSHESCLV